MSWELVRCGKCDKFKVVVKPQEPMPQEFTQKQLEKCSCETQLGNEDISPGE